MCQKDRCCAVTPSIFRPLVALLSHVVVSVLMQTGPANTKTEILLNLRHTGKVVMHRPLAYKFRQVYTRVMFPAQYVVYVKLDE